MIAELLRRHQCLIKDRHFVEEIYAKARLKRRGRVAWNAAAKGGDGPGPLQILWPYFFMQAAPRVWRSFA